MFILSYIYSTIIILFCFIKSMENSDFWSFILFGSIFAFLYANLIVLCKYAAIFVEKNIKKEKLSEKDIYYLITSTIIFVTIGVILTPMYDINQIAATRLSFGWMVSYVWVLFLSPVITYGIVLITSMLTIAEAFSKHDFSLFSDDIWINLFAWANFIVLCKYLYRFVRKTGKKEPLSQTDSVCLITALLMFVTIGVIAALGLRA